jgi:hypothetical protein
MTRATRIWLSSQPAREAVEVVVPADAVVGGEVGGAEAVGEDEQRLGAVGEEFEADDVAGGIIELELGRLPGSGLGNLNTLL